MGKKRSALLLLLFVAAFFVAGCVGFQEISTTPVPSAYQSSPVQAENKPATTVLANPTVSVLSSMRESIPTGRQVLEAMYGNEALSINDTEAILPAFVPDRTTTVHINLMACFWEGTDEKCLVVTDGSFDNCHVCQADIDGAIFQLINGSWELVTFQPKVISLGSFGYAPKGRMIQIGPDKHAALIKSGWAGQGYEGEYSTIIAEIDGGFRVVLNLLVSEMEESFAKDGASSFEWGYSSKMEFFPDDRSDYYNLVVTRFGVNREGKKFKTVESYMFSDTEGGYIMVSQR